MSPKTTFAFLLVAIVLAAAIYLTRSSIYTDVRSAPVTFDAIRKIPADGVREIKLAAGTSEIVLARGDDGWSVTSAWGYRADAKKVEKFLEALAKISDVEERALAKSNHASFEVDEEKGRRVELSGIGEGLPARFTLGKMAPTFGYCYFLLPGGETVYSAKSDLLNAGGLHRSEASAKHWLDLALLEAPEGGEVTEVLLTTSAGSVHLRKKPKEAPPEVEGEATAEGADTSETSSGESKEPEKDIWQVLAPESFDADENAARAVVGRATRVFRAADAVDPAGLAGYGLEPPDRRVEFVYADGKRIALRFGSEEPSKEEPASAAPPVDGEEPPKPKGSDRFYAQREGDHRVFVVEKYMRDGFFKTAEELKPPPPKPETPPPAVSNEPAPETPPPVDGE